MQGAVYGWKYRMVARAALNSRSAAKEVHGFLIHAHGGFGCVQPWPVFGHGDLSEHWAALQQRRSMPLLDQALECARLDGLSRAAGRSWWSGRQVPRSHATIIDASNQEAAALAAGFTHWKIKVGVNDAGLIAALLQRHSWLRLRLDFNEVPAQQQMEQWGKDWSAECWQRIDFLEDPFHFDAAAWTRFAAQKGVVLAVDRALAEASFSEGIVPVWKPAWQSLPSEIPAREVVVTSAMDHPVGQAWAALQAAECGSAKLCGLRTDHLYELDAFTTHMGRWSPEWPTLPGAGMGFDDLLEKLPWIRIR